MGLAGVRNYDGSQVAVKASGINHPKTTEIVPVRSPIALFEHLNFETMEKTDNEYIAEFMGFESFEKKGTTYWRIISDKWDHLATESKYLAFDSKWDDLMPVVEKIQNLDDEYMMRFGFSVMVNIGMRSRCVYAHIENWRGKEVAGNAGSPTLIECVYTTVVEFIKWYQNQPK